MLVCRHWRNVGINTPHLWRTIFVTRNLESLNYRLEKSLGCTIDVIFDGSKYDEGNTAALPLLLAHQAPHGLLLRLKRRLPDLTLLISI